MASDLPAPESRAPRPGAVTGGHGSNPEPTAHTCTTSERSAVAESGQKEKKRKREISPKKKKKKSLCFNISSRLFGIGLIYFMQSRHSAVIGR